MSNIKRQMSNVKKGFTLIELLIVIGIIAVLVAAVIIAINPAEQFRSARNATRWSHMNAIVNAIYGHVIDNAGVWPAGCPPACPVGTAGAACPIGALPAAPAPAQCPFVLISDPACATPLVPRYLPIAPRDPQTRAADYRIRFHSGAMNRIQVCPPAAATDTGMPEVIQ